MLALTLTLVILLEMLPLILQNLLDHLFILFGFMLRLVHVVEADKRSRFGALTLQLVQA
jgi:hypothetical protein